MSEFVTIVFRFWFLICTALKLSLSMSLNASSLPRSHFDPNILLDIKEPLEVRCAEFLLRIRSPYFSSMLLFCLPKSFFCSFFFLLRILFSSASKWASVIGLKSSGTRSTLRLSSEMFSFRLMRSISF